MKLYYAPGACSMAPHIVLREAGHEFELEQVDLARKQTETGADYNRINPKGYVPALELEDDQVMTEVAALVQFIADGKPDADLAPPLGSMERYRLMEWLNFIGAEIHKTLGALFNPKLTPEWKENQIALFGRRCDFIAPRLRKTPYLMGERFSVADAYLFTILNWTHLHKVDLSRWPEIQDYMARVARRPKVVDTMRAEGLIE